MISLRRLKAWPWPTVFIWTTLLAWTVWCVSLLVALFLVT